MRTFCIRIKGRPMSSYFKYYCAKFNKLLVMVLYIAIAIIITFPAILNMNTAFIGVGADPIFFMWSMKWIQFAITNLKNPLLSNYLYYPGGLNLMSTTTIILASFILAPITKFFGVIFSYNIVALSGLIFSAYAAYIATLRFVKSSFASFISGLIYGFSPFMIAQTLGHMHLTLAFIPPLLVWLGYDIFISQKMNIWKSGLILGALLICQFLLGEEILASEMVMLFLGILILCFLYKEQIRCKYRYTLKTLAIGIIFFLITATPFLYTQFFGPYRPPSGH